MSASNFYSLRKNLITSLISDINTPWNVDALSALSAYQNDFVSLNDIDRDPWFK